MTSNDAQIDILLRRYAGQSKSDSATEHLDADEFNAFAEGSLPEAARSRYVSHLADCDDCRKVVSQLAISSGAVVAAEVNRAADSSGYSWWKGLSGFFSPLTLRYAAFAVVLVTVLGVVFLVTRRPSPESALVAQNEQTKQTQVEAVKAPDAAPPGGSIQNGAVKPDQTTTNPQGAATPTVSKLEESKGGQIGSQIPAPPPKPEPETSTTTSPALAAKKAAEPGEPLPSYAPPPPAETERAEIRSREQQNIGALASGSGPRKSEQTADKPKAINGGRAGAGKDIRAEDDNRRPTVNQAPASRGSADEKAKDPRRDIDNVAANNRNSNEVRGNAAKTQSAADANREPAEEKAPETRSVGGRKFKHQGNAWVDTKFKSSMTVKSVSRGSSEFDALDSGLRSIAQQLGGEVIVVWKNKAYLIR